MSRIWNTIKCIFLLAFCVAAFYLVLTHYRINSFLMGRECEWLCYALWCANIAAIFSLIVPHLKQLWLKLSAAGITSLIYITAVFFANNYFKFKGMNHPDGAQFPYSFYLYHDIIYSDGLGEFRYPFLFFLMFLICGLIILFNQPKMRAKISNLGPKILRFFGLKLIDEEDDEI